MIDKVVKSKLCTNCGTCISVCPVGAIFCKQREDNFEIRVDKEKCTKCGLCLQVCPGKEVDFKNLNKEIFGKDQKIKYDPSLGYFKNCYLGYSLNKNIRFKCSSGGAITSILIYLLKNKIIDGALVTTMDAKNPLISKPFIAYTEKEIVEARGSKYTPVVLNQCLTEIIKSKKKSFAIVGLPCHIHGIRKFQKINPVLKKKVKVCLGIMCGQTVNFNGSRFFLKRGGVKEEELKELRHRGEGWPGKIALKLKNNELKKINFKDNFKIFTLGFFTPTRCFLCIDQTNELSDIAFCDAWDEKITLKDNLGSNFIISRTKEGNRIINLTKKDIKYTEIPNNRLKKSVGLRIVCKKNAHHNIRKIARFFNIGIPDYKKIPVNRNKILSFFTLFFFLNSIISKKAEKIIISIPNNFWDIQIFIINKILRLIKKFRTKI